MRNDAKSIIAALLAAWIPHPMPSAAQSYTIQKPGELPTRARVPPRRRLISISFEREAALCESTGSGFETIS
jgi:hypothetical protein